MPDAPYGGVALLADTSAWGWSNRLPPAERAEWDEALRRQQISTCAVVVYELGQGTFNSEGLAALEERMSALRQIQITRSEWHAALGAVRRLSEISDGYHRGIKPADALVAVVAERYGLGVLHYDGDFDRLRQVVEFENQWLAPDGSL